MVLDTLDFGSLSVMDLDVGLNLAQQMGNRLTGGVKEMVVVASAVRRVRKGLMALHGQEGVYREDREGISGRALWNNVKHGLEEAARTTTTALTALSVGRPPLVAARAELLLVKQYVMDRECQVLLVESVSTGAVPTLSDLEAHRASMLPTTSKLSELKAALDFTLEHFPSGPKSTVVQGLLAIGTMLYNVRKALCTGEYARLSTLLDSAEDYTEEGGVEGGAEGGQTRGALPTEKGGWRRGMTGPVAVAVRRELGWYVTY